MTLGLSGTLLACAILTEATSGDPETSKPLRSCGDTVMWRVWDQLNCHVPLADAPPICHLGVAHGWSRMVYAAMRAGAGRRARRCRAGSRIGCSRWRSWPTPPAEAVAGRG